MDGSPDERVRLDARRHGIVLVGSFARAIALSVVGGAAVLIGWPLTPIGAVLVAAGAAVAVAAVWRWERTHVVVTSGGLYVVHGTLRRRSARVALSRVGAVEVEQTLLGRLLGYGTIVAGELEIAYVAQPRELCRLLGG